MSKHCENCGWFDRRVWCGDHTDQMPCNMALRVTGEPCPWWVSEPIITQDAAHALLAACKSLLTLVMPVDCSAKNMVDKARKAIADAKGQSDAGQ